MFICYTVIHSRQGIGETIMGQVSDEQRSLFTPIAIQASYTDEEKKFLKDVNALLRFIAYPMQQDLGENIKHITEMANRNLPHANNDNSNNTSKNYSLEDIVKTASESAEGTQEIDSFIKTIFQPLLTFRLTEQDLATRHLLVKELLAKRVDTRNETLQLILNNFHHLFGEFAALTAVGLARSAIWIEKLIEVIDFAFSNEYLTTTAVKQIISNLQKNFIEARKKIATCMLTHLTVHKETSEKNPTATSTVKKIAGVCQNLLNTSMPEEEFVEVVHDKNPANNNDIIISIMSFLTNTNTTYRAKLQPDNSLMASNEKANGQSVRQFFVRYIYEHGTDQTKRSISTTFEEEFHVHLMSSNTTPWQSYLSNMKKRLYNSIPDFPGSQALGAISQYAIDTFKAFIEFILEPVDGISNYLIKKNYIDKNIKIWLIEWRKTLVITSAAIVNTVYDIAKAGIDGVTAVAANVAESEKVTDVVNKFRTSTYKTFTAAMRQSSFQNNSTTAIKEEDQLQQQERSADSSQQQPVTNAQQSESEFNDKFPNTVGQFSTLQNELRYYNRMLSKRQGLDAFKFNLFSSHKTYYKRPNSFKEFLKNISHSRKSVRTSQVTELTNIIDELYTQPPETQETLDSINEKLRNKANEIKSNISQEKNLFNSRLSSILEQYLKNSNSSSTTQDSPIQHSPSK